MIFPPRLLNVAIVPLDQVPDAEPESLDTRTRQVVLIVDDERLIADTLAAILTKKGYKAITAYDGRGALALARSWMPDVLVTDVGMPGMNGVELATAVVEAVPDCKVLLFSGHGEATDHLMEASRSGLYFDFMAKPVHPDIMINRVGFLIGSAQYA
jgi:DNA-binding NtrC family response regulator